MRVCARAPVPNAITYGCVHVHVPTLTAELSFPPELRQQLLEVHNVPPSAVEGYSFTVELQRGVYKVCARAYPPPLARFLIRSHPPGVFSSRQAAGCSFRPCRECMVSLSDTDC